MKRRKRHPRNEHKTKKQKAHFVPGIGHDLEPCFLSLSPCSSVSPVISCALPPGYPESCFSAVIANVGLGLF